MKRRELPLLLAILLMLLSGCWDFRSLDQRAFVVMAGVDRLEGGRFRVSFQIQEAGRAVRGAQGAGADASAFRVMTGEGETVREAAEVAKGESARDLDATFLDTIVIGEAAAEDLGDMDWFVRYSRIPMTAFIAVARGEAEPVVRARTPGFDRPADYTRRGFSGVWNRSAAVVRMPLWVIFSRNYFTPLEDAWAPATTAHKYGLNWDGLALFRGHSLAGFLEPTDAAIFNIIKGDRMELAVTTPVPDYPGARVTIRIAGGGTRRWVTWEGNAPVLHVRASLRGDVQELIRLHLTDTASQRAAKAALNDKLNQMMTGLLQRLQERGSDPLGFGELARQSDPYRPELQRSDRWHELYQRARLDVSVQVKVTAAGYTQ